MERCDICEMSFKTKKTFKVHKTRGSCKKLSKCHNCGTLFKTVLSLKKHRCSTLGHQCDVCSKYYKTKQQLRCHEIIHEDSRTLLNCNPCGKKFTSIYSFKNHNQFGCHVKESLACSADLHINTKEHNFICECGKTFKTKKHLSVHKHMHHMEEKGKSFPCPECDESFIDPMYMKTHFNSTHVKVAHKVIKIEKDKKAKCLICGRTFKGEKSMKLHMAKLACSKSSTDRRHDRNSNSEVNFEKCSQAKDKMEEAGGSLETSTWSVKQEQDVEAAVANFLADFAPIKVERGADFL